MCVEFHVDQPPSFSVIVTHTYISILIYLASVYILYYIRVASVASDIYMYICMYVKSTFFKIQPRPPWENVPHRAILTCSSK